MLEKFKFNDFQRKMGIETMVEGASQNFSFTIDEFKYIKDVIA